MMLSKVFSHAKQALLYICFIGIVAACSKVDFGASPSSPTSALAAADQICDPFGGGGQSSPGKGLIGSLHYLVGSSNGINSFAQLVARSKQSAYAVVFSKLDVPVRDFNEGISYKGQAITDDSGNKLTQWFGFRLQSILSLPQGSPAGYYQFRILSDDGAVLSYDAGSGRVTLINNDGLQDSTIKCSSEALHLDQNSRIPIFVDYYQGPPVRIALQVSWRQVGGSSASTTGCEDANLWQIVPPDAFNLPDGIVNKCE